MSLNVCPAALVAAPLERVWGVLMDPTHYDSWWDAHTERIEPAGPAHPGQTLYATSQGLGKRWPVTLAIEAVDEVKHQLQLRTTLPFGITMTNHISCARASETTSRVQFG